MRRFLSCVRALFVPRSRALVWSKFWSESTAATIAVMAGIHMYRPSTPLTEANMVASRITVWDALNHLRGRMGRHLSTRTAELAEECLRRLLMVEAG